MSELCYSLRESSTFLAHVSGAVNTHFAKRPSMRRFRHLANKKAVMAGITAFQIF